VRPVAAGKPIDTEALRRLRRLAASADVPPSGASGPEGERTSAEAGERALADEVARDMHRKGQPPRQTAPPPLSDQQRGWSLINPDAKPVRLVRPVLGERAAKPEITPAASARPAVEAPPTTAEHREADTSPVEAGAASTTGSAPHTNAPSRDAEGSATSREAETSTAASHEALKAPAAAHEAHEAEESVAASRGALEASTASPEVKEPMASRDALEASAAEAVPDVAAAEAGDEAGRVVVPGPRGGEREGRVRRVESVVGRDSGGWRRIAQVVVGGGGVRTDGSEIDEARARAVFSGSRRVVVLGCTGGAGQSTTALMLGHTLAQQRDDRIVAVDASTGGNTLTSRVLPETPETLTSLLSGLDQVSGYLGMRGYTTRTPSGLEVIGADTDADAEQRLTDRTLLSDHRLGQAVRLLDRHYKLAVIDPAAALAARVLPYADQIVLVVPASEEAPEAVAMTYEWLDGHGCADLRRRAVMVVNGVSRRSMGDVEQAESVARGRCRAIVRVPWEDDLAPGGQIVEPGRLRAAGRRAYLALAGVVVAGFSAQIIRPSEEELASDPPGTRIGER
jgi:MinD-like ATPase involved in chromosome partitioning or flagellar assembly